MDTQSPEIQHPKKRAFLAAYAECGVIGRACKIAEIDRSTHYEWLLDPAYARAFEVAKAEACDALEAEARRRAIEGVQRLKFDKGNLITIPNPDDPDGDPIPYVEHEYSDTLLIFLMKGAMPEKYRERSEVKHDFSNISDEDLIAEGKSIISRVTAPQSDA